MHGFTIVYDWPISHLLTIQYMNVLIIQHYYTNTQKAAISYVLLVRIQSFYKYNICLVHFFPARRYKNLTLAVVLSGILGITLSAIVSVACCRFF